MTGKIRCGCRFDPHIGIIFISLFIVLVIVLYYLFNPFGAPHISGDKTLFTVQDGQNKEKLAFNLEKRNLVKSGWAFRLALRRPIEPGGYYLTGSMNAWEIAEKLGGRPDLVRLTIPEGWRREQTASLLAEKLHWNEREKNLWMTPPPDSNAEPSEGLCFPDTYLIPCSESPVGTGRRLRYRFNEVLRDYIDEALRKNIQWTTLVILASIIEREAAGNGDRALISGILWNRLQRDMKLDADSTVQYVRDTKEDNGLWWEPLDPADKQIDSPYNTYRHRGLPPSPISSPGRASLEAALRPLKTDYLYYLHDKSGGIHCAKTYSEHLANIEKYLTM